MNDKFKAIQIETYHGCNLNCWSCPNSKMEKHGELMDEKVYFKIMKDLKERNYTGRISPYGFNEPTLDERLPMFIEETRKIFPDNPIMIGSNGIEKDMDYYNMLFEKGMSQVLITCYNKETEEKFKKYEDGKKVRLFVVWNRDRQKIFMNRAGNIKVGRDVLVLKPCDKALKQAMIDYQGNMVLCCADYYSTTIAGNVMDKNVIDLWNCDKFLEIRYYLKRGMRDKIGLCSQCNFLRDPD